MSKLRLLLLLSLIFCFGWLSNSVLTTFLTLDLEKPLFFSYSGLDKAQEKLSPSDRIKENQVHVFDDKIVLDVAGASWASFVDTNSMDPLFDAGANSLELPPKSPDDVKVGDVVSYRSQETGDLIIHRVIAVGSDEDGVFYTLRGDNNGIADPGRVRFEDIHGVVVGILY
jgi:hypothetical protein